MKYKIVRHYFSNDISNITIQKNLTLEEAKEWCNDPETSSATCTSVGSLGHTIKYGEWFDGFYEQN